MIAFVRSLFLHRNQRAFMMLACLATAIQVSGQDSNRAHAPIQPPGSNPSTASSESSSDLLDELLRAEETPPRKPRPAAGEDLGADPPRHPILRVGEQMARVEELLRRQQTSAPTQRLQVRIVRGLDALIASAEQQAGPGSSRQPQDRRSEQNRAAGKGAANSAGMANAASPDAAAAGPVSPDGVWMNRIWGHLPDRLRSEIQTPVHETFLPAYERIITEYYKRLNEVDR